MRRRLPAFLRPQTDPTEARNAKSTAKITRKAVELSASEREMKSDTAHTASSRSPPQTAPGITVFECDSRSAVKPAANDDTPARQNTAGRMNFSGSSALEMTSDAENSSTAHTTTPTHKPAAMLFETEKALVATAPTGLFFFKIHQSFRILYSENIRRSRRNNDKTTNFTASSQILLSSVTRKNIIFITYFIIVQ